MLRAITKKIKTNRYTKKYYKEVKTNPKKCSNNLQKDKKNQRKKQRTESNKK